MKHSLVIFFCFGWIYGGTHSLILEYNSNVNIQAELANYNVVSIEELTNEWVWKVVIDDPRPTSDVLYDVYYGTTCIWIEANQIKDTVALDNVVAIDGPRGIFLLDSDPLYLSSTQVSELSTQRAYVDDGSNPNYDMLYTQYHVYETRAHFAWPHTTGVGVRVAVLDTGIDMNHEFLRDNIIFGYDFIDEDADPSEVPLGIDSDNDGMVDEGYGHGTHVAGIVKTIAPNAYIIPIRVVDSDGNAELFDIVQGIRHAIIYGADVINLSLSIDEPSDLLQRWIDIARFYGVMVVTSAGNANSTDIQFPATANGVVTVTSVGPTYVKSEFSNFGNQVDVSAPGEMIMSAHPGDTYIARSGTSMAAPQAAGIAALVIELVPSSNLHYRKNRVTHKVYDIDIFNHIMYDNTLGRGLVDSWDAITVQNLNNQ